MATELPGDPRRKIPSVDRLLAQATYGELLRSYGREAVRVQLEQELEELRARLGGGSPLADEDLAGLPERLRSRLEERLGRPLRRVVNATGVFLHTNLGRAPLPRDVVERCLELATGACDLEYDLERGQRGDRTRRLRPWLCALTGAEDALVTNNNAAALVLAVAALAQGREVVVSRGELVEIGGSFRIPEILEAAGGLLREVGTTNRTHLDDYRRAVGPDAGLILKVHTSNYRQTGFVAEASLAELVELGRATGVPVLFDQGSGLLRRRSEPALQSEPSLAEAMELEVDLACGSADKLLGGPQAGILLGRRCWIERLRRHPLARALRLDRLRLVALEAVLRKHHAGEPLPIDRLWVDPDLHRARLERVAAALGGAVRVSAEALVGGGAAPERPIPGEALALEGGEDLLARLRQQDPPVVGYVRNGQVLLDLRTVEPELDPILIDAVRRAREGGSR